MAWRNGARLSGKHIKSMNKKWHALRPENPHGVSKAVMKALATGDLPLDKKAYQEKFTKLMKAIEANGRT